MRIPLPFALSLRGVLAAAAVSCPPIACGGAGNDTATTSPVVVAGLRFTAQPGASSAGESFSATVELVTSSGARATTATNRVTVFVVGGATLLGTTSADAVNGVAQFSGLTITRAGENYTLTATASGLSSASASFTVEAAGANGERSAFSLPSPSLIPNESAAATFQFRDSFGNAIAQKHVALTSSLSGLTFAPGAGTTDANGMFRTSIVASPLSVPTLLGTLTATVNGTAVAFPVTVGCVPTATLTVGLAFNGAVVVNSPCSLNGHAATIATFTIPPDAASSVVGIAVAGQGTFHPEFSLQGEQSQPYIVGNSIQATSRGPLDWLLPAGTYRIAVSSADGATGEFSIATSNNGAGAQGCPLQSGRYPRILLGVSATYTGQSLSATDCVDPSPSYFDAFVIQDDRPCTITVHAPYSTFVQASDLDGQGVVTATNESAQTEDTRLSLSACSRAGRPVLLAISSADPLVTGPYTLTVSIAGAAVISSK